MTLSSITLVLMLLGGPAAASEKPRIQFYDMILRTAVDLEKAKAYHPPKQLSFTIDGKAEQSGPFLVLNGVLRNNGPETEVVVLPSPAFFVEVSGKGFVKKKTGGPPPPPPVPPTPERFVVKENGGVLFMFRLLLDDYEYAPGTEVVVKWSFLYWNDPRPKGDFRVKLEPIE